MDRNNNQYSERSSQIQREDSSSNNVNDFRRFFSEINRYLKNSELFERIHNLNWHIFDDLKTDMDPVYEKLTRIQQYYDKQCPNLMVFQRIMSNKHEKITINDYEEMSNYFYFDKEYQLLPQKNIIIEPQNGFNFGMKITNQIQAIRHNIVSLIKTMRRLLDTFPKMNDVEDNNQHIKQYNIQNDGDYEEEDENENGNENEDRESSDIIENNQMNVRQIPTLKTFKPPVEFIPYQNSNQQLLNKDQDKLLPLENNQQPDNGIEENQTLREDGVQLSLDLKDQFQVVKFYLQTNSMKQTAAHFNVAYKQVKSWYHLFLNDVRQKQLIDQNHHLYDQETTAPDAGAPQNNNNRSKSQKYLFSQFQVRVQEQEADPTMATKENKQNNESKESKSQNNVEEAEKLKIKVLEEDSLDSIDDQIAKAKKSKQALDGKKHKQKHQKDGASQDTDLNSSTYLQKKLKCENEN